MVRTRGGRSDQGRESSSQPVDRVHPTALARQRRSRQQVQETQEDVVPDQAQQEVLAPDQVHQEDLVGVQVYMQANVAAPLQQDVYGGGPEDTSILRTFHRHVATRLWNGEDWGTLKVVSHGRKLTARVAAYIWGIVDNSGLASLINCTHSLVDRALLSTFPERCHRDTCSFHLPAGEMTITLDDVSSLLHLPVTGCLFSLPAMGSSVRLRWLRDLYENSVQQGNLDVAARAYLLHLVGCTIFVDKLGTLARVGYLGLFRDLDMVGTFAWGATALAFLYENLKDASFYNTRQIAGYMTLLQLCDLLLIQKIIVPCQPNSSYEEGRPLSKRWAPLCGTGESIPPSLQDAFPGECADDSLGWYYRISHPYLIPSVDRVADPVPRRVPRVHIVASTFDGTGDVISYQGLFQGISERLQAMFARELVTPGTELGVLAQEALDMANLGVEGHQTGRSSSRHVYRRRRDRSTQ
ncbi:Aminotransferase-like, plant mobile domain [Sesbania bispinosa]|nr:Aminotransferase-like, plant mobile domain [Sesbania bispinosa]